MASVFAQLSVSGIDHGVHVVLVPIRNKKGKSARGVTITDRGEKAGLLGVDNGRLSFDQVRVPRANLLDRYARITDDGRYESPIASDGRRFFTMLGALVAGRISIAAASVSVAKTALTTSIRYSDRRVQFGPAGDAEVPILDYLLQQRALLPRLATTYGLHFAVRDLVARYEGAEGDALREVEALAAGLKAVASTHAMETIQASREACGGEGYAAANRFGELREDADIFTTFEGANPVLLQLVAKALLGEYRDEMGDLKIWDLVKVLADRGQTRVAEMNPVAVRTTDADHLRDPEFHAAALSYREERLLGSVARRLKSRIDDGMDSFGAMNACQDHLAELATAHIDRIVQERFVEGMARAPTPGLSEALGSLVSLYGLSRLEANRAWYLEAGYFESPKSRAIREQVNQLCAEVRETAVFLVGGFGIPDDVLEAPAGLQGAASE
jgi:acyl-CoA oxidase